MDNLARLGSQQSANDRLIWQREPTKSKQTISQSTRQHWVAS
jgi:hypothetical protein